MAMPAGFKIRHWTEEETARLAELWLRLSDKELAALFGRSKKAVKEKRERMGLKRFEVAA